MTDSGSGAEAAPGRRARVRRFLGERSGAQRIGALAAFALVLTGPFGGLAKAEDDSARLTLGETYDIGQFEVTLEQVLSLDDLAPALFPDEGSRLLVLDVTIANATDEPQAVGDAVRSWSGKGTGAVAWAGDDAPSLRAFTVDDATELYDSEPVNPGQTLHVVLVLQQQADWDPDALEIELYGSDFTEDAFALTEGYWVIDDLVASGHVDAEVKP